MERERYPPRDVSVPEEHDGNKASDSCATVAFTMQWRAPPVPECRGLLARVVLNVSRAFSGS